MLDQLSTIRAIAFDLDGTLLDTLPDIADAADRMLAELGRPQAGEDAVRRFIGNGIPRLVKRLLTGKRHGEPDPELFDRALPIFERHYRDTFTLRSAPYPNVVEGLQAFKAAGLRLGCVTNKAAAFTEPLLRATRLDGFFEVVLSGDNVPRKKPDPLPIVLFAERLGVALGSVLVIGDSPNDAQAARAAGCPVFCVPYGYRDVEVRDLDCDVIVRDLLHAFELLRPASKRAPVG